MDATIDLKLYATLAALMPGNASRFPITDGMTVGQLVESLPIAVTEAKLIFVDGKRAQADTRLHGGERVGIFPPVGGG
ncbi:MAG: MoaD/ThiS family protein [Desulfobacteraceae bacterium]